MQFSSMFARSVRAFYPITGSFFSVSEDRILFLLFLRQEEFVLDTLNLQKQESREFKISAHKYY